jgi:hypothetical protein
VWGSGADRRRAVAAVRASPHVRMREVSSPRAARPPIDEIVSERMIVP